jgi:GMP synthase (glutamine-hydrolysing)
MKRILVFQHVAHEILGTFHPLLKDAGFRIRHINFGRHPDAEISPGRYDGLVVLGGPMGVYEADRFPHLQREIECIRDAIREGKPVLGICLGAQLIASALGAKVTRHQETEIGWYPVSLTNEGKADPILGELAPTENIFQWHGDTFQVPRGAVLLASSQTCPHQAFRYGDKVYGFQFHLEVDEPMVERWLRIAPPAALGFDAEKIRQETHQNIQHLMGLSGKVFSKYIHLFSTKRRKIILGSGHR